MKEYDIFLKRRLTEGTIIVYSLPFRDGVSVVNRTILQAMLSYFSLQKKIAVANKSVLLAELDEMLATVSEKIKDQICLESNATFTIKYQNELEQAAVEIGLPDLPLFAQSFFTLESQIGIQVSEPIAYAKSSLGEVESLMGIIAKSLAEKKQVFDVAQDQIAFGADVVRSHKQSFELVDCAISVSHAKPDLLYRYAIGMESAFAIAASLGETEFHYSLGDGSSEFGIEILGPKILAEKRMKINDAIEMFCKLVAETVSLFSVSDKVEIATSLNAGMKRYRLLSELDDMSLTEVDDMDLGELDFVVLA